MSLERTLSIIKPDATERNVSGRIITRLQDEGFRIIAMKLVRWDRKQAEAFYNEHKNRDFFEELVDFMTSGPIVLMVLEREEAVSKYRQIMGATDPNKAMPGTIRKEFAINLQHNSVHGSDSPESAQREIALCFDESEIVG
jgi:nucleoside-diphosphate kinase